MDKSSKLHCFRYIGSSMYPTLRPLDILQCELCRIKETVPGDIIIFINLRSQQNIVHRVIARKTEGLVTRGDNRNLPDEILTTDGNLIGKVIFANRGKKKVRIYNGFPGLLFASFIQTGMSLVHKLKRRRR
jgi:signal peptidase I